MSSSENVTPASNHAGIGSNNSTVKKSQTPEATGRGGVGNNDSTVKRRKPLSETSCLNTSPLTLNKKSRRDQDNSRSPALGHRAEQLLATLEQVLVKSVDSFTFQNMRDCFPKLQKFKGPLLDGFCVDMLQEIRSCVGEEFQNIMEVHNVYPQLRRLDHLYDTQPVSFKTGLRRPPPIAIKPEQITKQQVLKTKRKHVQDLEVQVDAIFKKNQSLRSTINMERALHRKKEEEMSTLLQTSTQVVECCRDTFPEN